MTCRILLTGKTGQVGGELERLLPELGEVIAVGRAELDLTKPQSIREFVQNTKPAIIVNAAAYTAVDRAETERAAADAINADAAAALAEEAKKQNAVLVHYSTDYVFDGTVGTPYEETAPTHPVNFYGETKLRGEKAIVASGAAHLIFRVEWVYGNYGRNFLLTILRLATEREELRIVGDQIGAPTWSREIARGTVRVLKQSFVEESGISATGIYNMTAGGQATWHSFASAILEEARGQIHQAEWLRKATNGRPFMAKMITPISTAEYPTPAQRPAYSIMSNARFRETFGFQLPDWRDQLKAIFDIA